MRSKVRLLIPSVMFTLLACGSEAPQSEGYLEVQIDTDAPLPSTTVDVPGVFDAVAIDLVREDGSLACEACSRELGLTRELVDSGASFVARVDTSVRMRARLFSSGLGGAALEGPRVVERWVRLPAKPAEGRALVRVELPIAALGTSIGSLNAPTEVDATDTQMSPAQREPARAESAPGIVCVPGGFFWMGDPRLPYEGELSARETRLVQVSPFCVDAHEATVAQLRTSGVDTAGVGPWSGKTTATSGGDFCAYTPEPGPNEARAVNCVPWATARAYCQARGGDLPTEAQLEYLGTGFGRGSFVWGTESPACADAVFARAVGIVKGDRSCRRKAAEAFLPASAETLGQTRDVLRTEAGEIVGLASNVAEWTREEFAPYDARCGRAPTGLLRDPECVVKNTTTRIAVRGGAYTSPADGTAAAVRAFVLLPKIRADLGFRCVY